MKLAITILGGTTETFITEMTALLGICHCDVVEMRGAGLTQWTGLFLVIEGHWNQVARLEALLEALVSRHALSISFWRPDDNLPQLPVTGLPYMLEIVASQPKDLIAEISRFLFEQGVRIEEIAASRYQAPFFNHTIFSCKCIVLIPDALSILSLREDFLDFCDELNIDGILEPIKR